MFNFRGHYFLFIYDIVCKIYQSDVVFEGVCDGVSRAARVFLAKGDAGIASVHHFAISVVHTGGGVIFAEAVASVGRGEDISVIFFVFFGPHLVLIATGNIYFKLNIKLFFKVKDGQRSDGIKAEGATRTEYCITLCGESADGLFKLGY